MRPAPPAASRLHRAVRWYRRGALGEELHRFEFPFPADELRARIADGANVTATLQEFHHRYIWHEGYKPFMVCFDGDRVLIRARDPLSLAVTRGRPAKAPHHFDGRIVADGPTCRLIEEGSVFTRLLVVALVLFFAGLSAIFALVDGVGTGMWILAGLAVAAIVAPALIGIAIELADRNKPVKAISGREITLGFLECMANRTERVLVGDDDGPPRGPS